MKMNVKSAMLVLLLVTGGCAPASTESWSIPSSKGSFGTEKVGVMGPSGPIGP
jgi:hypothetical protein